MAVMMPDGEPVDMKNFHEDLQQRRLCIGWAAEATVDGKDYVVPFLSLESSGSCLPSSSEYAKLSFAGLPTP